MQAELAISHPTPAGRYPSLVVADVTARKASRSGVLWGAVFGLYVATSALGYSGTYKTTQSREHLAATLGNNLGFNALIGPAHQIGTVAGFTAWRSLGVLALVGAVWGLLTSTRLLRGEEEAGRWEVLLAGPTTKRSATARALGGLGGGLVAMWGVTALITVATGRSHSVGFSISSSMFLALALTAGAALFLAVGALASQVAPTRRQAAGWAASVLGAAFVLRMIADSGVGVSWLRWVTPLGWIQELQPLTAPKPLMLLPIFALTAICAFAAVHLAGVRDIGDSLLMDRTGTIPRTRLLGSPILLAVRLTRGVTIAWGVSLALIAFAMGLIAKSVGDALVSSASEREALAKLGYRGSGAEAYLAATFLLVATLVLVMAAGEAGYSRGEEAEGRLDNLLVRPVTRSRWLAGRLLVATAYLVGAGFLAGSAAWVGVASQHGGISFPTLVAAGMNVVPPALFVLGIGTLAFGLRPRVATACTYGLIVWSLLIDIIGGVVKASHWLLDTSLVHQMSPAPASQPNWTVNVVLVAIAVAAGAAATIAFSRRDLVAE